MGRAATIAARFLPLVAVIAWTEPGLAARARVHTVAAGESLGGIAIAYGCSVGEVIQANGDD